MEGVAREESRKLCELIYSISSTCEYYQEVMFRDGHGGKKLLHAPRAVKSDGNSHRWGRKIGAPSFSQAKIAGGDLLPSEMVEKRSLQRRMRNAVSLAVFSLLRRYLDGNPPPPQVSFPLPVRQPQDWGQPPDERWCPLMRCIGGRIARVPGASKPCPIKE
ncbi:hypothetical protein A9K55_008301 [Cordyceps militaris]|uniref:Uncharacterized protein n=1 Tax=Cordyceps militaris TaxID=73501 RepID=A0A2H4SEU6_CORMI|nr:hypothetical protein A9K55_008301 [Cordyceps militaris]